MNDRCGYPGEEGTLCGSLLRASRITEGRIENELGKSGLSLAKLGVLEHLKREARPLSLSRLAERLACVKSNMTQLMDRLESEGLVERVYDIKDRRTVLAAITKEGIRKYELGNGVLHDEERDLTGKFGRGELKQLLNFLARVH